MQRHGYVYKVNLIFSRKHGGCSSLLYMGVRVLKVVQHFRSCPAPAKQVCTVSLLCALVCCDTQSNSSSKRGCCNNLTLKDRMAPTPITWAMVPCPSTSTAVKPIQQGKTDEYYLSVSSATDAAKGTSLPAGSPVDSPLVPLSTSLSPDVACCLTVGARPNLPATRKAVVEVTIICSSEQIRRHNHHNCWHWVVVPHISSSTASIHAQLGINLSQAKLTMFSGEPMNPAFTLTGLWLRLDRTRTA